MTSLLDPSDSERGAWRFRLFGVPVRVLPWFWIVMLIMGARRDTGAVLIWVGVCFVSILMHEFGHVAAMRLFGMPAEVALYAWGGLAIPTGGMRRSSFAQILIALAGPLAGFSLAALTVIVAATAGAHVNAGFSRGIIPSITAFLYTADPRETYYWNVLLSDLLWVNVGWGMVNLLPIYPLDGGHVSQALFAKHNPVHGRRRALLLSACVGAAMALLGLLSGSMYMVAMFGFLAAGSAQAWEAERPLFRRSPGPWRR